MENRIPIYFSGPRPEKQAFDTLMAQIVAVFVRCGFGFFTRLSVENSVFLPAADTIGGHLIFFAKMNGFPDGAICVVSALETAEELITRLTSVDSEAFTEEVERNHSFPLFFPPK